MKYSDKWFKTEICTLRDRQPQKGSQDTCSKEVLKNTAGKFADFKLIHPKNLVDQELFLECSLFWNTFLSEM